MRETVQGPARSRRRLLLLLLGGWRRWFGFVCEVEPRVGEEAREEARQAGAQPLAVHEAQRGALQAVPQAVAPIDLLGRLALLVRALPLRPTVRCQRNLFKIAASATHATHDCEAREMRSRKGASREARRLSEMGERAGGAEQSQSWTTFFGGHVGRPDICVFWFKLQEPSHQSLHTSSWPRAGTLEVLRWARQNGCPCPANLQSL